MSVYPFTNAGLQAKLSVMYNQSDLQLAAEADLVAADFKAWVLANFILDSYQQNYFSGVPAHSLKIWGHLYASAFLLRSPMVMSALPANPPPRRTKQIALDIPHTNLKYDDASMQITGTININIQWTLL